MIRKIFILLCLFACAGCYNINSSIMFKTPPDFKFTNLNTSANEEYKLAPNDVLEFRIYTNDGFKLIDVTGVTISNITLIPYLVEKDGNVKLPMIGRIQLKGMTPREAEKLLEEKYATFYNKPFVTIK